MAGKKQKPKDDPAMKAVRAVFKDSGLSLVELGKRMGYADEMARQAAWQFMQSNDPRVGTLRKFSEAVGVPLDQLTPRRKRMARRLEDELEQFGCSLTAFAFREHLEKRKMDTSPDWTIDDLICHPKEAMEFAQMVRGELGCPALPDYVILRALMNIRKSH